MRKADMVKQLMKTEWTIQSTKLTVYMVILTVVYGIFCFTADSFAPVLIIVGFLAIYFYLQQTFSKEDGQVLLLAAPFIRDDFVKAKFTAAFLYLAVFYALTALITAALSPFGMATMNNWAINCVLSLLIGGVTCAVVIPIFFKFGYIAGRNLQFIAIALVTIISIAIVKQGFYIPIHVNTLFIIISIGVLLGSVLLSYKLCLHIMRKKQF